jgi:hypothetical protein
MAEQADLITVSEAATGSGFTVQHISGALSAVNC